MKHTLRLAALLVTGTFSARSGDYNLTSLAAHLPVSHLSGGSYNLTAVLAQPPRLKATSANYSMQAIASHIFIAHSSIMPTLIIRLNTDNSITLFWTDATARFDLETSSSLAPNPHWEKAPGLTQSGPNFSTIIPSGSVNASRFFRLTSR